MLIWNKAKEQNKVAKVEETKEYIEEAVAYEEEVAAEASSDYNYGTFRKDKKSVEECPYLGLGSRTIGAVTTTRIITTSRVATTSRSNYTRKKPRASFT